MRALILATLITIPTTGCNSGADTNLEDAFCQVLALDNAEVFTAAAAQSSAPDVTAEDLRVEIELVDNGDGMFSGLVAYTPDEAGHFAFGFDEEVPVTVRSATGGTLPWVAEVSGAVCAELAVRRTVELDLETVFLEIGPTAVSTVSLAAEESNDDL